MPVLTLTHRPVRFVDMVGQTHIRPVLRAMVVADDLPPALIFEGSRGTGKTTTARILAAALNCERPRGGDACGECSQCLAVQRTGAESVLEIDAASNGGVEEVRKIKDMCMYAHSGRWRVVLLDEAHSMTSNAFNALLKILEEPPPRTIFVLLTTEADRIIETVRSRSMTFSFRRISEAEIHGRLRSIADAEGIPAEDDLLRRIAAEVQGGMRDAVMQLDQCGKAGISSADQYADLMGVRSVAAPLLRATLDGDLAEGYRIIEEHFTASGDAGRLVGDLTQLAVRCIVARSGGRVSGTATELAQIEDLSRRLDERRLTTVIRLLWELKDRTRTARDDQRSSMEMALVLISEALRPDRVAGPIQRPTERAPSAKLSLADISARLGAPA